MDGALLVVERWRPNLILGNLQINYISMWVQFHGLPLEYQYPELVERMGQMMGIVERVDWEDTMPRNIRFMRNKVRVDPWLPLIAGFMLRLDDGSRVWIQCRYERLHKLCTRCGLIGHARGHCSHRLDDVEVMLFRQRLRIQELYQVQYRFDGLQPQFTNELRASYNRRKRWTTQVCVGQVTQNPHQSHSHLGLYDYPDPSTPSTSHFQHATTLPSNPIQTSPTSIIQTAINILNLNVTDQNLQPSQNLSLEPFSVTPTPVNSPVTLESNQEHLNANLSTTANPIDINIPPISNKPSWQPPTESNLQWTSIEGNGPFITNGQSSNPHYVDSESDSDTTAIMFNLDKLNETRPEVLQRQGWDKGCIPESPDSFIENLVQRVDRGRSRFEWGDSSNGPRLMASQRRNSEQGATQEGIQGRNLGCEMPTVVEANVTDLGPFEQLNLGPGPPTLHISPNPMAQTSNLLCNEYGTILIDEGNTISCSRKRIRNEIGKIGRNIRQKFLCAVFDKEMANGEEDTDQMVSFATESNNSSRLREAGLQQLPQQP